MVRSPVHELVRGGTALQLAIEQEVRRLGFDRFSYRRCRVGAYSVIDNVSTYGQVLDRWHEVYRQRDFGTIDPRFQAAASSPLPEIWDRSRYPDTPKLRELFDTADALGVGSGICFVLYRPDSSFVDFFHIAAANPLVDAACRKRFARAVPEIWALAIYGYASGVANALTESARKAPPLLTERQLGCLSLAATGLKSRQIADVLAISERTVEAHIQACIARLGARNRSGAIASAINASLINVSGRLRPTVYRASTPGGTARKRRKITP